ncbi:amidophosphoribosyltransferase [Legionella genomosp. 1]|uniref:amidophosphoribosyltransferase n=1 Tax=Legionella genomosp. 1 TaxID=1093625 RepID=UPI001056BF08|nr:amidophosphoribosyltransferase [Legionella genomosp. 1]
MCGIVGIISQEPVANELFDSLIHLQHRGQDAAGILTCDERFYSRQGLGLVREIFNQKNVSSLLGNIGIGHTRYPTAGGYTNTDIQPLWIGSPRGIAMAHNGNLTNYQELAEQIRFKQKRHLNSSLDSEVLLLTLADQLANSYFDEDDERFFEVLCRAVEFISYYVKGAYSIVSVVIGKGLVCFRDPHGIRPLVWGSREGLFGKTDYIFASETTPFYALGFKEEGDVLPGEVVYVSQSGQMFRRVINKRETEFRPCVFEYVYFSRPDATINHINVYRARLRMGQNLCKQWKAQYPDIIPDVVVPVPFTANTAALSFAREMGVRYTEALYKNPFIGRTFIMPNVKARKRNIRYKLTPLRTEIQNKSVLIVDDSIVRGATSREIVKMIKEMGAKKIYLVSTCPPIKYPCFYGIDIPSSQELIASNKSEEEIANEIGVDILLYQSFEDLIEAVTRRGDHNIKKPCMSCMDGEYFCKSITPEKIKELELQRAKDKAKK